MAEPLVPDVPTADPIQGDELPDAAGDADLPHDSRRTFWQVGDVGDSYALAGLSQVAVVHKTPWCLSSRIYSVFGAIQPVVRTVSADVKPNY